MAVLKYLSFLLVLFDVLHISCGVSCSNRTGVIYTKCAKRPKPYDINAITDTIGSSDNIKSFNPEEDIGDWFEGFGDVPFGGETFGFHDDPGDSAISSIRFFDHDDTIPSVSVTDVFCCKYYVYNGTNQVTYEFPGNMFDIAFTILKLDNAQLHIKSFNCDPDGECYTVTIDESYTFLPTLPMNVPRFALLSGGGPVFVEFYLNSECVCEGNRCERDAELCQPGGSCRPLGVDYYICCCSVGFFLATDGHSCLAGPCLLDTSLCSLGGSCVSDTTNTYHCDCHAPVFVPSTDQLSCLPQYCVAYPQTCRPAGFCVSKGAEDFECSCIFRGFTQAPDKRSCIDINECDLGYCVPNGQCYNTQGSFICNCDDGHVISPNGTHCIISNPCEEETSLCRPFGLCESSGDGTYQCLCFQGFHQLPDKKGCVDINECLELHCRPNGDCINLLGSFKCKCFHDYVPNRDETQCIIAGPCEQDDSLCGGFGECITISKMTYHCRCFSGFRLNETRKLCLDIDECTESPGVCLGQNCFNTEGSYICY